MGKRTFTTTILDSAVECLRLLQTGGIETLDAEKNSLSGWIEQILADFLRRSLSGKVNKPLLESCRSREEIIALWLAIQKAGTPEGRVRGFKIYQHPKQGIIAVQGPENPVDGLGEIVPYPPRKQQKTAN